jgi:hypothetical protein
MQLQGQHVCCSASQCASGCSVFDACSRLAQATLNGPLQTLASISSMQPCVFLQELPLPLPTIRSFSRMVLVATSIPTRVRRTLGTAIATNRSSCSPAARAKSSCAALAIKTLVPPPFAEAYFSCVYCTIYATGYNYKCGAGEEACNLTTNVEAVFFGDGV